MEEVKEASKEKALRQVKDALNNHLQDIHVELTSQMRKACIKIENEGVAVIKDVLHKAQLEQGKLRSELKSLEQASASEIATKQKKLELEKSIVTELTKRLNNLSPLHAA